MEGILIACLVLLPMLASPAVYPLRRHSQAWRNHFVRTLPLIELACAAALILFPAFADWGCILQRGACGRCWW